MQYKPLCNLPGAKTKITLDGLTLETVLIAIWIDFLTIPTVSRVIVRILVLFPYTLLEIGV
jgi:hypothetical protein